MYQISTSARSKGSSLRYATGCFAIAQLDLLADEVSGDAVAVALEVDVAGFGHLAGDAEEERLAQGEGVDRAHGRGFVGAEAVEGRLAGLGVDLAVVDDLEPGEKREVQSVEGVDRGSEGQLGQEARADKAKEALDLALGFRRVGLGQDALPVLAGQARGCRG